MAKSLLVTGAAGFIGANFAHYWMRHHPEDRVVARKPRKQQCDVACVRCTQWASGGTREWWRSVNGDARD